MMDAGEIPAGWDTAPLGRLIDIKSGFACSKKNLVPASQGVAHLRPFNVGTNGEVDLSKVYHIPPDFKENVEDYALKPGHVLFNNTNSVELVGKAALVTKPMPCTFSNHLYRLAVKKKAKGRLDSAWLTLALQRLWAMGYFAERCNRWIGQAGFNAAKLREVEIPLPPLDEQRGIVARIEALFDRIAEGRRLRVAAGEDADRLLDATVAETMSALTAERIPLMKVLSEKPRNGWSPRGNDDAKGVPVLRLGAVLGFRYDPTAVKFTKEPTREGAHYWLRPGDLLISRSNTPKLVGHAAIYNGTPTPCIYPDLLMRMRVDEKRTDPDFVVFWLRSPETRHYIGQRARGASSTMKKISQGDVREIPFPQVPLSEQHRIVEYLDGAQVQVAELKRLQAVAAAELERLGSAVLARAFRGEL